MAILGFPMLITVLCLGTSLKSIISLYNYSGYKNPPLYGDYEAQRHWQEITVNIPMETWYINSTDNDLLYWGLDYPPLTAYHSYILGKMAGKINSTFVKLQESRGLESREHKFFMRTTVLVSDIFVYYTSIIFLIFSIKNIQNWKLEKYHEILLYYITFVIYPGQTLIDNGHFQYNNMSLGFTLWAINFILLEYDILASFCFSLALNYKQMELYHAVPFFVYLLWRSIRFSKKLNKNIMYLTKVAMTVIFTFLILWIPWIFSLNTFVSILSRIFPFDRGVFEDKVSNFWCVFNTVIKLKQLFTNKTMTLVCLVFTGISQIPSIINLSLKPSKLNFMYALLNSSLGFYLFSYQVHEKSILIPALSALALFHDTPIICFWFLQVTIFSMFPLLHKDGLLIGFIGTNIIYEATFRLLYYPKNSSGKEYNLNILRTFSLFGNSFLVMLYLIAPTPQHLPHLYNLLISVYCCLHFITFLVYFNLKCIFNGNKKDI